MTSHRTRPQPTQPARGQPMMFRSGRGHASVMRFMILPATILQARIPSEAKLAWGVINFFATPTGTCTAPFHEIGAPIGLSKRAIMRTIPELLLPGFLIDVGSPKGAPRRFSIPSELRAECRSVGSQAGTELGPIRNSSRSTLGTGPLPKSNRTDTDSGAPYKEEVSNNRKSEALWQPPWEESTNA